MLCCANRSHGWGAERDRLRHSKLKGFLIMSQPSDTASHAGIIQYDRTLILAIELSSKSWVLAAQVPGLPQIKAKRTIEPDKLALASAAFAGPEDKPLELVHRRPCKPCRHHWRRSPLTEKLMSSSVG